MTKDIQATVDAVWRMEAAHLIGALARMTGDVGTAEEVAHDALVTALERWPETGVPDKPGAWLMATAKHRAIDRLRRDTVLDKKVDEIGRSLDAAPEPDLADVADVDETRIDDDVLRLMFIACHPVLSKEARVALTLRLIGGLTTAEIARAFLTPEKTIGQRIVRAKRTLSAAKVPFAVPEGEDRSRRLSSVLEVIYLIFNEGYASTQGDAWLRPEVCREALRLGRMLAELCAMESEVHGLVALMELHASRFEARMGSAGQPILLLDQDRRRWDRLHIRRGLAALARAESLGGALGPYALQAAIAACHARAATAGQTDWPRIVALYDALAQLVPSPVVELNRAVAVGMAFGPEAGLEIVDALRRDGALAEYHLLWSVRGDLLWKLRRFDEARAEFARAASLTRNAPERELLSARARATAEESR